MENNKKSKGSFLGLVPLCVFLVLYFAIGIGTGSFDNMPLMIGITIAIGIALVLNKKGEEKLTFEEKVTMFCKGAGDSTLVLMVVIFLLAGAFYGIAGAMHASDSVTNFGLSILPSNMVLPGLFVIGCILSFSMGTSMGTVSALMPIAVSLSSATGFNMALVCGVVVGGALFGDNLSFISDTTIAATRTQDIPMRDKFKANILMVLPAVIITLVLLYFQPMGSASTAAAGEYSFVNMIPYVIVIVLSLLGVNVITVMSTGVLVGVIIGVMHGDFTLIGSLTVIHEGMTWMEDMALIAVLVGGLVALMNYLGGIDWLLYKLTRKTKTARGAELSIAALVSLIDISTTNNTISIIAAGPIARDIADEYNISRARTASILDLFSSGFQGLLPYGGQLLTAGALAGISPAAILPYCWYSMLMIVFGVIFILIGWPKMASKAKPKLVVNQLEE
ncbi:Na+/H+ antiporter NhaC family protein [Terrisporobacter mayombei]|uniref:Malate-2H(+)/Na(+)-lactate antiporter n=1 Tax=Terrisporobacter mayombei TaxID=1541 RepID=A0ABY9PXS4_9FIRM|nr:Na+/H+ antiporter NhaC family protein [Terrisporobacter mayombei]MCC3867895.1 Na+/H+ antiporter NhaC family protein [Terrisporobacter mayombei]WMT80029.1 Malate-2H(+)/Na(+)-lactate antiporter [Terrisporobacter mayombei]